MLATPKAVGQISNLSDQPRKTGYTSEDRLLICPTESRSNHVASDLSDESTGIQAKQEFRVRASADEYSSKRNTSLRSHCWWTHRINPTLPSHRFWTTLVASTVLLLLTYTTFAKDPAIALDSEFPDPNHAKYFAGELTLVEHVNRKGILRLDRDGSINKYYWDLPHEFQMLPYGAIYFHGAPAELKDIPIGTHLHGEFYLGPEGPFEVKPPTSNYFAGKMGRPDSRSIESQYSRVLRLEDDFSYYQRKGIIWVIKQVDLENHSIAVESNEKQTMTLRVDRGTRVWKNKAIGSLSDLQKGQTVMMNLGWVTLLGSFKQDALCREIWLDKASQQAATEVQRGIHIEHQMRRGVPAMVIKTEHDPGKGAKGWVTAQLTSGVDTELLEALSKRQSIFTKCVEPSLRMYSVNNAGYGGIESVTKIDNPAPGSSGVQLRVHFNEMQEGHRKGRIIRIGSQSWFRPKIPREEWLRPTDIRAFKVGPKYIVGRELPRDKPAEK